MRVENFADFGRSSARLGLNGKMCKKLAIGLTALLEIHFIVSFVGITFNEIEQLVVHSTNLKKFVFTSLWDINGLTKRTCSSLIEAWKKKQRNENLSVFMYKNDLDKVLRICESNGVLKMLTDHSHIIKLLPLEQGCTPTGLADHFFLYEEEEI